MTEQKAGRIGEEGLGETIRRELGSRATRLFLGRMPAFRPDAEIPERFRALLDDLDRVEAAPQQTRG